MAYLLTAIAVAAIIALLLRLKRLKARYDDLKTAFDAQCDTADRRRHECEDVNAEIKRVRSQCHALQRTCDLRESELSQLRERCASFDRTEQALNFRIDLLEKEAAASRRVRVRETEAYRNTEKLYQDMLADRDETIARLRANQRRPQRKKESLPNQVTFEDLLAQ